MGEGTLTVAIIPHTRQATNITAWREGTVVNLEADMLGKYVRRELQHLHKKSNIDEKTLRQAGFID